MSAQIGDRPGRTLLLGVTPELADIAADLVAVDRNPSMVRHVWPGNSASRRAIVGDWRNRNFAPASFSCCVGDTSFGALLFPDEVALACNHLSEVLQPGGKFVCRVFVSPDVRESIEAVRDAVMSGAIHNFHAFKFRLGMALLQEPSHPRVGVDAIFDAFNTMFKDRDELSRATGWARDQIDTIDYYRGSEVAIHFPTRDRLLAVVSRVFPGPQLVPSGSFELAERSPLLVAHKAR